MRLTKIQIQGFRAFAGSEDFDVDADAVIVSAANGRGKTSLFDAILWGVAGTVPRLREDSHNIVSLYSESGEASVSLEFVRQDASTYRIRRTSNGTDEQLSVQVNGETTHAAAARLKLLTDLWPSSLSAEDSGRAVADMVARGVYLQQDLVRQFIEADSDQERFEALSELIGAGRVTEFQKQLENSRKAWSAATNTRKRDEDTLRGRVASLESDVQRLSSESRTDLTDPRRVWREWWEKAQSLGLDIRSAPEDPSSIEAHRAVDAALKQLQIRRRASERRLDLTSAFLQGPPTAQRDSRSDTDLEEAARAVEAARSRAREARDRLRSAEHETTERRRVQVETRELGLSRRALAELALRHLSETCPICTQPIDAGVVRAHLETILRAGAELAHTGSILTEPTADVTAAARHLAECEADEARSEAALRDAQRSAAQRDALDQEQGRRLAELDVEANAENAVDVVTELRQRLTEVVAEMRQQEAAGEHLALSLARAGEQARRSELERQLITAREELAQLQQEIAARQQTGRTVDGVIEGLRDTASDVVNSSLAAIEPVLGRIYARVDPHPAFRLAQLRAWLSYGRGRISMTLSDPVRNVSARPLQVLSSSQMNALAVSMFLALNIGMPSIPLRMAVLDDPLQSLDDVNLLGVSDLLRRIKDRRQLFVSTHDPRFSNLLQRKLRPTRETERTRLIELEGWSRSGPKTVQRDVPADERPVRIVAA